MGGGGDVEEIEPIWRSLKVVDGLEGVKKDF